MAVRNEEQCILSCLKALNKVDYPTNLYEILIGNDASTDKSKEIIEDFIKDKANFYLLDIVQNTPIKGKANVLAQLAKKARGDFYFFTDADTQVPKTWLKSISEKFDMHTGVVVGVTTLQANTFFAKMQAIDWLFAISIIKKISDKGIPVTALGNNMAVSKKAYLQTGGYEKIPFSLTEDFALFKEIIAQDWEFKQLLNKDVLAFSQAQNSLLEWLTQRKRWMRGALKSKWYLQLFLWLYVLLFPLLLLGIWSYPISFILIWTLKIIFQAFFIQKRSKELNLNFKFSLLLLYELYVFLMYPLLIIYYALPIKINWKGRTY